MSMSQSDFEPAPQPGAVATIVKAVLSGCAVAVVGLGVWGGLLTAGSMWRDVMPLAVPIMGGVLILGAAYLRWSRWPKAGRAYRRAGLRFNRVRLHAFVLSLVAGWSTMLSSFCLYVAHRTVAGMGGEGALALPNAPFTSLLPGLLMAAFVAGAVEEVAFRGFMQGAIERRLGIVPAVAISGFVWALFHTNHSYFGEEALVWFAIFLAVSTMLGAVAYRTDSLIPGIAVHAGFDAAYFVAAGLLHPSTTPIAFVQSIASPQSLLTAAAGAGAIAILSLAAFLRETRAHRHVGLK